MTSRRIVVLVATGLALLACTTSTGSAASVPDDVKCFSSPSTGTCGCTQFDYGAAAWADDAVAAPDCNTPPANASWRCCVNSFTAEKKVCSCGNWHCRETDEICMCGYTYQLGLGASAVRVSSCSRPYCRRDSGLCVCTEQDDGGSGDPVESCSEAEPLPHRCSEQPATSCANVEWAQPEPAGSASGDPNKPECSNDTDCSSKCSDCPGCRSGSCKCGRRGVSGSCLF